ncbi:MAG: coenzyme F420-0:L-glutamate ligase [Brevinematales bacterium]|nr:coenzyme F420-0:L-glutamate ligase [Brevinematales bacterium]
MVESNQANPGKVLRVTVGEKSYERIPIKTHVVMPGENLLEVVKTYAGPLLQPGDVLFITEKVVAVSQRRAFPVKEIRPRKLAIFLSRFVTKTKHGIGLGIPETMEMALRECGVWRILLAAAVAAITKPLGRRGDFYRIAGYKASSIDGPTPNTLPPYNEYVVLGPDKPNKVAQEVSKQIGVPVLIVDLNDLGGRILGVSDTRLDKRLFYTILRDNPLGQSREQTPLGIIRPGK